MCCSECIDHLPVDRCPSAKRTDANPVSASDCKDLLRKVHGVPADKEKALNEAARLGRPHCCRGRGNMLRTGVIWFQVFVHYGPRRRNTFFVLDFTKIFATQPRQRRAVHFCVPADKIMNAWVKWFALGVIP